MLPTLLLRMISLIYGLEIATSQEIGGALNIAHAYGVLVLPEKNGMNCSSISNVTIGLRDEKAIPVIADDVFIGARARVLSGIHVGNQARIGTNAVVIEDVPKGATVVGVPARLVGLNRRDTDKASEAEITYRGEL